MEHKFKIGDKVKVLPTIPNNKLYHGSIGTIYSLPNFGTSWYCINFDKPVSGVSRGGFEPNELELVSPPRSLQVGDRVKVTASWYQNSGLDKMTGYIHKIRDDTAFVKFPGKRNIYYFHLDDCTIEKFPPLTSRESGSYNFKVSDPEQIDVQRICDEAPENVDLIVVHREDKKNNVYLVRESVCPGTYLLGNGERGVCFYELCKDICGGKEQYLTGWMATNNEWDRGYIMPHNQFLARLKEEIAKRKTPPPTPRPKKINVKVSYA